ncbi:MAG TPA: hypothetical protein VHK69_04335, partial [Chitinophagaceae bacterium]|nr:hypothetical protein [Chitinophagaceae bacterium]
MWKSLGVAILRYRVLFSVILALLTAFLAWQASQVQLSYEFAKAIPTDHPKYIAYQGFKKKFGEDGNLLAVGIRTDRI